MDPNATLEEIRELIKKFDDENEPRSARDEDQVMFLINSLDEWLSKGGFLPKAWER